LHFCAMMSESRIETGIMSEIGNLKSFSWLQIASLCRNFVGVLSVCKN